MMGEEKLEQMTNREMALIDKAERTVENEMNHGRGGHKEGDALINALELLDHIEARKSKLEQRQQQKEEAQFADRIAAFITNHSGTLPFFFVHVAIFTAWVWYNLHASQPFDEYPFGLLTTAVSLEAIILSVFILLTQNRQARQDTRRDEMSLEREHLDLKVDTVAAMNTREATLHIGRIEQKLDRVERMLHLHEAASEARHKVRAAARSQAKAKRRKR